MFNEGRNLGKSCITSVFIEEYGYSSIQTLILISKPVSTGCIDFLVVIRLWVVGLV